MTPTNIETGEPGLSYITTSLKNGFNVITANKGSILLSYRKLYEIALNNHVQLGWVYNWRGLAFHKWWYHRYGRIKDQVNRRNIKWYKQLYLRGNGEKQNRV